MLLHLAFQLLAGALLIEAMFWSFDKVPFTCSYYAGRIHLSVLAGLYLYGFTTYSFHLAALQHRLETDSGLAALVFTGGGLLLAYGWRRVPKGVQLRFDGEEPVIRTLDLT